MLQVGLHWAKGFLCASDDVLDASLEKEITEKLQGDYGGVDKDIFSLVKKCLAKYEAAYLIVFSKY